ncbi:ribonuclease R [bacterium BMS3Bbin10]|nr:ribonuclease R [bacterium BMS3Bbin10]
MSPQKKPGSKSRTKRAKRRSPGLPSKADILKFIQSASSHVGKREIARAFQVKGTDKIDLKRLLREMADEGLIKGRRKRVSAADGLPPVTVIEITGRDADGEFIAHPAKWDDEGSAPPRILLVSRRNDPGPAPGVGDRVLARLTRLEEGDPSGVAYEARLIKRLPREPSRLLGIFRAIPGGGGVIDPIDRKQLREWSVHQGDTHGAKDGDLVRFEIEKSRRFGPMRARVVELFGNPDAQGAVSLIALHSLGLPDEFPEAVLNDAEKLIAPTLETHDDLRDIPFITIDPPDARDHDDAVWAAPDDDAANPEGWVVMVGIADVAHFVKPGSSLDKEALKRGNSIYFPDRVVPMLPERISSDLCSLREGVDRACLCVRMVFDASGAKISHRFSRGIMRSRARLNYAQAQAAIDGKPDEATSPILENILRPLWQAYAVLARARDKRGPLDLDLPERKVVLGEDGQVERIVIPPRLEAHRLIEEFMIQSNVAAAEILEAKRSPLIYRAHDAPSREKLETLRDFLASLSIDLPKSGRMKPEHFNRILAQARAADMGQLVSEVVLRSQAQAEYSPANVGHFGLNLRRYAHFTSPIRRYADLIVHRALIRACDLGPDGLTDREIGELDQIAQNISDAERRAIAAERQTVDRLIAAFLADRIGVLFAARVSGVVRTGLFVRLEETGADGFVPASSIGGDYFRHDERRQALIGDRTGMGYSLGDRVEVRLIEAIPSAGALRFEMLSDGAYMAAAKKNARKTVPRKRKGRNRAARRRQR